MGNISSVSYKKLLYVSNVLEIVSTINFKWKWQKYLEIWIQYVIAQYFVTGFSIIQDTFSDQHWVYAYSSKKEFQLRSLKVIITSC